MSTPARRPHVATPLELFFDLAFVVAIATAAGSLHHAISEDHATQGLVSFLFVFFAIWWAWMNFTWFASAFGIETTQYRILVFVQITGSLIIAAGVASAFEALDTTVMTIGYVVMRIALVYQWFAVSRREPQHRRTALRYANGIILAQALWISILFAPADMKIPLVLLGITLELLVPVYAERAEITPFHHEHIRERYGLFTIIVLGESVLAASLAIHSAYTTSHLLDLMPVIAGGLVTLYAMWWIYFNQPKNDHLSSMRNAFLWGYGHYLIFGSAAAVGAGIAVIVDTVTHHSEITLTAAHLAFTIPVSIYLLSLWIMHIAVNRTDPLKLLTTPVICAGMLLSVFTPYAAVITGSLLVIKVVIMEVDKRRVQEGAA